jgi:hypothetical protein
MFPDLDDPGDDTGMGNVGEYTVFMKLGLSPKL